MEEVFAVYIWSQDWWTFSNDSWSGDRQVYTDSRIVSPDKVDWQKVSDGEAYHASLYFEIGKKDAHDFRPTSIMVDNVDQPTMVVIEGEEIALDSDEVIGEALPFEFAVGQEGYYEVTGMALDDFIVTEIIAAKDEEAKEDQIVSFIEGVNEADMATVESMSAETFAAPRKKPSKRMLRRGNRSRNKKNMMQMRRNMGKQKRKGQDYTTTGYAETLEAETFRSESASDNISADTSKAVEGINPTPVSDGQWLAETISKRAEAKHNYAHRVIDGDDYVHYDSKGRQTRRTNRGRSISADRRRYTPNANLKPGQGHLGDFVREAQGYNDRMDESLGMSHRGRHSQSMRDRRDESAGMERSMGRRKYSRVGTMDRGNRMMAESKFDRLSKEIEDEYVEKGMSREEAEKIGDATAAKIGRAKYGKRGMANKSRRARRAESLRRAEMTRDDRDMMSSGMERYLRQRKRAESPMTSPEDYTPMGSFSTDMNPQTAEPSSAGTGDQIISVDSPSAPPNDIKFAEDHPDFDPVKADRNKDGKISSWERKVGNAVAKGMAEKNAEFGVVGSGSNFGQDLNAENWCTKHSETFDACGCEKKDRRAEPSGAMVTNEMPTGDDPLDDSTLSGFDIVNVDSPSAPPSDVFVQSAEMNYDGSLYGDQYFPDALTANQVGVGALGSANSAPDSGQGVLQWDGSREGPDPDTKASEVMSRLGGRNVLGITAFVAGLGIIYHSMKK
tara:strand:+ start:916 stop:3102 length:2187 start_codon:yes stop_codon:yes gene_type:complete